MFLLPGAQEVGRLWLNRTEWAGIGKGRSWKEGVGRGLSSCLEERRKSLRKRKHRAFIDIQKAELLTGVDLCRDVTRNTSRERE